MKNQVFVVMRDRLAWGLRGELPENSEVEQGKE